MTSSTASEKTQLLNKRTGCKCKNRVRWFYSKGAFLVLVWVTLVSVAGVSVLSRLLPLIDSITPSKWIKVSAVILVVPMILSGWLADAKYGNYKVARFGLILQFFGTLSTTICSLFLDYLEATNKYLPVILLGITIYLFVAGLMFFYCDITTARIRSDARCFIF